MGSRAAALAGGLAAFLAGAAPAVELETLVMPGPVVEAHAEIESECSACHRPFDRAAEDGLCRACHDDVDADLALGTGFHGRAPEARERTCRSCHPEHRGRDADVIGLEPALFDHARTDWPLAGAHRAVPCAGCHEPEARHRDAAARCGDCHASDDPHRGRLGADCGACHGETSWREEARFDHAKTDFPLEGAHRDVACGLCHPDEAYEGTPADCATCHVLDDVHRGSFGRRCESCHGVADWKRTAFDHAKTDFPLEGRHADVACAGCHTGLLFEEELGTDCLSCHRADDVHAGRYGARCESCHGAAAWDEIAFDHARETDFPLRGRHAEAACTACHRGTLGEEELGTDCVSCHRADDVHAGQQGEACGECHGELAWARDVRFDHGLTRFPLLGLHAAVACEECHATPAYRDVESACAACHAADDEHAGKLGSTCGLCHNPNGWPLWRFDHTTQTTFALHGAHEGVDCHACHQGAVAETADIELGARCADCHAREDPHRGRFGSDCARCHAESDWKAVRLP
jgi:hypothetical protein